MATVAAPAVITVNVVLPAALSTPIVSLSFSLWTIVLIMNSVDH